MPERSFDSNSVRKSIHVNAAQDVAWRVFTQKMGTWWPLAYYIIGKANAIDAVIEPRVGGRWYERGGRFVKQFDGGPRGVVCCGFPRAEALGYSPCAPLGRRTAHS